MKVASRLEIENILSSRYHKFELYSAPSESNNLRLLIELLEYLLPKISRHSWEERKLWGGLYFNGRPGILDELIQYPCKVEYYEPRYTIAEGASRFPSWSSSWIVYEDEDILAVNKPTGLPTQPGKEQQHFHLKGMIEKYVKTPVHLPSRLDLATSGLVIASKSPETHRALQHAFAHRKVTKLYTCRVTGFVTWDEISVTEPIGHHPDHPVLRKVDRVNGKQAATTFRVTHRVAFCESTTNTSQTSRSTSSPHHISTTSFERDINYRSTNSNDKSWSDIEANPLTGRTHQIRVHLASQGHPIVGDRFYAGPEAERLYLHCHALSLPHPRSGQIINLESQTYTPWQTEI